MFAINGKTVYSDHNHEYKIITRPKLNMTSDGSKIEIEINSQ